MEAMKDWQGPGWKRPWFVLPRWVVIVSGIVVFSAAIYVAVFLWMVL